MERFGNRAVNTTGLVVLAGGFLVLGTLQVDSSDTQILAGLVPLAAGIGLSTTPATAAIIESLPAERQGVASAVNDTARELGGAIGIAVLGSLLNSGYRNGIETSLQPLAPDMAERARDSLAFVVEASAGLAESGRQLLSVAQQAFVDGFQFAAYVATGIAIAGALFVYTMGRHRR